MKGMFELGLRCLFVLQFCTIGHSCEARVLMATIIAYLIISSSFLTGTFVRVVEHKALAPSSCRG
jgi:hypothetical protein